MPKIHKNARDWPAGSKRRMIAEQIESGMTAVAIYNSLRPLVMDQVPPMIFTRNPNRAAGETSRVRKPLPDQILALRYEINRVFAEMGRDDTLPTGSDDAGSDGDAGTSDTSYDAANSDSVITPADDTSADDDTDADDAEADDAEEIPAKPTAAGKERIRNELRRFLAEVRRIRAFCADRKRQNDESIDWISMRPVEAASKLIPAGVPAEALLNAMAMHWEPEIRRDAGIPDFDWSTLSSELLVDLTEPAPNRRVTLDKRHHMFNYIMALAHARQPILLVGPAGTGKSHIAKQIAMALSEATGRDFPYGETPISSGATRGDLTGRMTANPDEPFILSKFGECYSSGGVFNLEELDSGDPGMLLVINNALAGTSFFNSANGREYKRHPDFVCVATANTFGIGADAEYTGRDKLDLATLDRFRMGRVFIDIDAEIEEAILVQYI